MQATTSPGGVGTESLPTTLAGEIERLRYVIKLLHGGAQWYPGTERAAKTTYDAHVHSGEIAQSISGTASPVDIAIPAGVTAFDVIVNGWSTDIAYAFGIQLSDAGGPETAGYVGGMSVIAAGATTETANSDRAYISSLAAARAAWGVIHFRLWTGTTTWHWSGNVFSDNGAILISSAGAKALSAALTGIRVVVDSGATTDSGTAIVQYRKPAIIT